jgi:hypothetical protein
MLFQIVTYKLIYLFDRINIGVGNYIYKYMIYMEKSKQILTLPGISLI